MRRKNSFESGGGSDLDEAAVRALRAAWKSSPGLVASLVFHALVLAVLPFIIFHEQIRELAGIPITINVEAKRIDPERPYKPVSSAPPAGDGAGLDEPPMFFPDAVQAERNEAKGDEEKNAPIDGDSRAVLMHLARDAEAAGFKGRLGSGAPGTNDVMGVGGGSGRGGARFGAGLGGRAARRNLACRGGGSQETELAVELGLSWLLRHQRADGSWKSRLQCQECHDVDEDGPVVASTALAALAFMTAGYGPNSKVEILDRATGRMLHYGKCVSAAIEWLAKRQQSTRLLGSNMYEHSFATMALCEAYKLTKTPEAKSRAQKVFDYVLYAQNKGSAWQYTARCGKSDTSVMGACVQALRAARGAGFEVPEDSLRGIRSFLDEVTDKDGTAGYQGKGDLGAGSTTAIGLYTRKFLEPGPTVSDKLMPLAAKRIEGFVGNGEMTRNTYQWYYSMLALFELEGPKGDSFKAVNAAVTTALLKSQCRKGCTEGAWEGAGDGLGNYGRPLVTAMSVLTLETYYRYADEARTPKPAPDPGKPREKAPEPSATAAPR